MRIGQALCWTAILLVGACVHTPAAFQSVPLERPVGVQACPETDVDTAGWRRHSGRYVRFSVLLPPDLKRVHRVRDRGVVAEVWGGDAGLQLFFDYSTAPERFSAIEDADPRDGSTCLMRVGATVVEVQTFEERQTTAPGQRTSAIWRGSRGEELSIGLISRNPARRDEVLAIIRSVVFVD